MTNAAKIIQLKLNIYFTATDIFIKLNDLNKVFILNLLKQAETEHILAG